MMWYTRAFLWIGFALFSCVAARNSPCPPANMIKPCECFPNNFLYFVECGGINDMETLVGIFERSGDRTFSNFALYNSTLNYLPAHSLSAKRFNYILLANVTMSSFFDQQPDPSNQVSYITMMNCRIQRRVGWELFSSLNKLKYFYAMETEISKLGKSFADNINPSLTNFIMYSTKTKKIHDTAFARLGELFDLRIVDSEITTLKRSMFAMPSKLEQIDFTGNRIKSLPDDIFSSMPYLTEISFERNQLTTIAESAFGGRLEALTKLDLQGNPFICDCKVQWIPSKSRSYIKGTCAQPEDKTGRSLASLNREDFRYCEH